VSCVAVSVSALEFNMERAASKLCASLWAIIMSSHNRAKRDCGSCILEVLLLRVLYCGHSTQYSHLVFTTITSWADNFVHALLREIRKLH